MTRWLNWIMILGMKLLYLLSLLLMSLCFAETAVKPKMSWNEFSERYEQMNHDALSLADVDFLQRAYDYDLKIDTPDADNWVEPCLFYFSESKTPLPLSDVDRDKLHYLIQTERNCLTLVDEMFFYRVVEFVYRYDVDAQVYHRIKWDHADFRELVNREYPDYFKELNLEKEPLLLQWIALCQQYAKPILRPNELEYWLAQAPKQFCDSHGTMDNALETFVDYDEMKGLSERPPYVFVMLESVASPERMIKVDSNLSICYTCPKKYLCYRYDKQDDVYVFDASVKRFNSDEYFFYEMLQLPIKVADFESLMRDLAE